MNSTVALLNATEIKHFSHADLTLSNYWEQFAIAFLAIWHIQHWLIRFKPYFMDINDVKAKFSLHPFTDEDLSKEELDEVAAQRRLRAEGILPYVVTILTMFHVYKLFVRLDMVQHGQTPFAPLIAPIVASVILICATGHQEVTPVPAEYIYIALGAGCAVFFSATPHVPSSDEPILFMSRMALTFSIRLLLSFSLSTKRNTAVQAAMAMWSMVRLAVNERFDEVILEVLILSLFVTISMKLREMDVTSAKNLLDAARSARTEQAAQCLVNSRTDAVVYLDSELKIINAGWQAGATLGCERRDLEGVPFERFVPVAEHWQRFESMCRSLLNDGGIDQQRDMADALDMTLQTTSEMVRFQADVFHVPLRGDHGEKGPAHMLGICRSRRRTRRTQEGSQEQSEEPIVQTLNLTRPPRAASHGRRGRQGGPKLRPSEEGTGPSAGAGGGSRQAGRSTTADRSLQPPTSLTAPSSSVAGARQRQPRRAATEGSESG